MKARYLSFVVMPALLVSPVPSWGEEHPLYAALKSGTPTLNVRLRYEEVDNDIDPPAGMHTDEAQALTVRTRLGYRTGKLGDFDAYVEFEDTHVVAGVDDYQARSPAYAVIADPAFSELNQAWVRYVGAEALSGLTALYGRQRIIYDNARFVGNVGWRQNEQTFDGMRVDYTRDAFALSGAYLTKVNTITGAESFVEDTLVHASWLKAPGGSLTAYAYLLEPEDGDSSLDTYGLRYSGRFEAGATRVLLTAEFADQTADPGAGSDAEATYTFIEAGVVLSGVTLTFAREVLGSDDGTYGFDTPLATKHAFNGWADKFLATPASGLEDTFVSVAGSVAGIGLTAVYHQFGADDALSGGADEFGDELDLQAVKKFGPYAVGVKYAAFRADSDAPYTDTDKLWLWTELAF